MKAFRGLAVATMVLAAAWPALAADQIFHKGEGPEILDTFDGKPLWELQAMCAGFHGATANYYQRVGDAAQAGRSEAAGVAALNDAVGKIRHDRGLDEAAATQLANTVLTTGGRAVATMLREDGLAPSGRWNYWRSFCIDANATFHRLSL